MQPLAIAEAISIFVLLNDLQIPLDFVHVDDSVALCR